ncbi:MAG: flagellar hook-basal body complex protein, partial [Tepidanaerobacteraceae bacterium]
MMRSLFSGVTGLRNHQIKMDVIGNNIANVNTVGFKKSRVTFQDTLSQTMRGAAAPQGNRGGTNPMQVGLGMTIASIDTIHSSSSAESTGNMTDLAIEGEGYFILQGEGLERYFTRAGNFGFDTNGNLVNTANGLKVLGWQTSDFRVPDDKSPQDIGPIQIRKGMMDQPSDTTQDGYTAGTLTGITVDTSGVITGIFDNGLSWELAQIAIANFDNPAGLIKVGQNMYSYSNNSGEPQIG